MVSHKKEIFKEKMLLVTVCRNKQGSIFENGYIMRIRAEYDLLAIASWGEACCSLFSS